jgi:hypothetical protein
MNTPPIARIVSGAAGAVLLGLLTIPTSACSASGSGTTVDPLPTEPADAGAPKAPVMHDDAAAPMDPPKKQDAGAPPDDMGECSSETSQDACVSCCSNKHMNGSGVYMVALIDCVCMADNCAKECASTLCQQTPTNADATCQTCVQAKNNNCAPTVKSKCLADADCTLFDACVGKSNCATK